MKKPRSNPRSRKPAKGSPSKGTGRPKTAPVQRVQVTPLQITQPRPGRPTIFQEDLIEEFLYRVASGRSIKSVTGDPDMPDEVTIYRWGRQHAGFSQRIARARRARLAVYIDQLGSIGAAMTSTDPEAANINPVRARVAIEAFDRAARLMRDATIKVVGPGGGPVQVATPEALAKLNDQEFAAIERAVLTLAGGDILSDDDQAGMGDLGEGEA